MYRPHTRCRACGFGPDLTPGGTKAGQPKDRLVPVLDLGLQPLANDFAAPGEERAGYAPLHVLLCPRCNLAQLSTVVRPDILYARYSYVTSPTKMMQDHFAALWAELSKEQPINNVTEIGSNDGTFLKFCLDQKVERVLGIDPAENLVKLARGKGVNTLHSLFDTETARMASTALPAPDLIIARHVFCHVDNWQEFMHNIGVMCSKETLVAVEIPYVVDMLQKGSFDQVYHEHLSYLNVRAIQYLLDGSAMRLQKILRFPIHGGVIVLLLRRRDSAVQIDQSVRETVEAEKCGLDEWAKFDLRARDQICSLKNYVHELVNFSGKKICGYGASAKSTVWINACGFTKKEIQYVTDSTFWKVYRTVPGTDIPIVQEGTHIFDCADYAILFAWNYAAEVIAREKQFIDLGGKFIIPIPEIRVLP
jgi:SAM-dependent methyltransferase